MYPDSARTTVNLTLTRIARYPVFHVCGSMLLAHRLP